MLLISTCAVAMTIATQAVPAATEEERTSAPFDPKAPLGLQTLQKAITSAGFHCPVAQRVTTALEDHRGRGLPRFVHTVFCRELGVLDVDRNLTYRVQQQDSEPRFHVRRLRQTD
jgi:hypothetical protein